MAKKARRSTRSDAPEVIEGEAVEVNAEAEIDAGATEPDSPVVVPEPEPDPNSEPEPEPDQASTFEPETETDTKPGTVHAPRRRGGFLALVLGGVIAAMIGFAAARTVVPEGWPFPGVTPEPDPLAVAQAAQAGEIDALQGQVADLNQTVMRMKGDTRLNDLGGALMAVQDGLSALQTQVSALDERLRELEKQPKGDSAAAAEAAAEAYQRDLAELRKMFEAELAKLKEQQTAVTAQGNTAQDATERAALAQVMAALDNGRPFAAPLAELQGLGVDIPAELTMAAQDGVPTLAFLQEGFPGAARAALDASVRADVAAGKIGRIEGFFRVQLGTRSLEPRAGDDPDAVLSRAEAALKQGEIADALSELEALPEAGKTPMSDWISQATARLAVLRAGDALAQAVGMGQEAE